jgi:YVTN family beta-propeller protein
VRGGESKKEGTVLLGRSGRTQTLRSHFLRLLLCLVSLASFGQQALEPAEHATVRVGQLAGNSYFVATGQRLSPAGTQVEFFGRPVDLALCPTANLLAVKNSHGLVFIDTSSNKVRQVLDFSDISFDYIPHLGGGSFTGIAWEHNGRNVWVTDAYAELHRASLQTDGTFRWTRKVLLPGPKQPAHGRSEGNEGKAADKATPSTPGGIAIDDNDNFLYVTLSQNNALGIVKLASGELTGTVQTGVAPFTVLLAGGRAFVSNWGGRIPRPGELTSLSAGTPVLVDSAGTAKSGTVSVLDLKKRTAIAEIEVERHASGMAMTADGKRLFVANANSDTVSVIDTERLRQVETIPVSLDPAWPFGSEPNAVAVDAAGNMLYIAVGGENAIAIYDLQKKRMRGFVPTAWYPGSVLVDGTSKRLYVANVKGIGNFGLERGYPPNMIKKRNGGKNAYDYAGSVSAIAIPDESTLANYTEEVHNNLAYVNRAFSPAASEGRSAVALPASPRQESVFKHVIYIIKENRTYDEVLGDMKQGNGDARLCMFCGEVTPNHHALASQFVLLDNFYVNGQLSADGHQWTDEGIATDYVEKSMGGFSRSYPSDGTDPLAYSAAGFVWDQVLEKGLTFRNYGEFVESELVTDPKNATWQDFYSDYLNGTRKNRFQQRIFVATLQRHTSPNYPPFGLIIPDVYRAQHFLEEFRQFEATDSLPSLMLLQLGNDHTSGLDPGMPSPRAAVADNDLALGQIVDAVSHSKYWRDTAIFVVEDDAQDGLDHVDGRRSLAFVVSAYTRRGITDSTFYNQNSVLRSIQTIFHLPPLTLFDYFATTMNAAFSATPDLAPYTVVPNRIPLDEMNPNLSSLNDLPRKFALWSTAMDFSVPDRIDENRLNRVLWFATHGNARYPARTHASSNEN